MATFKFTARKIEAMKPPTTGRTESWDTGTKGFGLRVSKAGRKTWVVMYRHQGRLRRLTLGTYPNLPLAEARARARDALHRAAKGGDPAAEKQSERRADTFAEFAEEYLERHAKRRKRSWRKDALALQRDLLPAFGHRRAKAIKRKDVIRVLDAIVERGAPIQANRTLEILRKIYNWGIARDIVETNPCHMVERPSDENRRDRVLSDDEIRVMWPVFEQESPLMAAMFKMRVLTAQRGGEVAHMRWEDIDLREGWWTIPGEYTKNGLSHRVPLNLQALDLLAATEERVDNSPWVFPSPSGKGPITVIWKAAKRIRDRTGINFVPHDLRRSVASKLTGDLGISRLTVAKILNHTERGVTSVYDRYSYDDEKCRALDAWGRRLEEILSGETGAQAANVVRLPSG